MSIGNIRSRVIAGRRHIGRGGIRIQTEWGGNWKREIGKWTERAAHFGPPVSFWGKEGHGVPCPYREGVKGARCDCEVNLGGRVRPQKRRPGAALQGVRPDDARSGGWVKMAT
jgi:hypothetical protein